MRERGNTLLPSPLLDQLVFLPSSGATPFSSLLHANRKAPQYPLFSFIEKGALFFPPPPLLGKVILPSPLSLSQMEKKMFSPSLSFLFLPRAFLFPLTILPFPLENEALLLP